MDKHEEYKLKGYLDLLEKAPASGRYVHESRGFIMVLRWALLGHCPISELNEDSIKDLIRDIYR